MGFSGLGHHRMWFFKGRESCPRARNRLEPAPSRILLRPRKKLSLADALGRARGEESISTVEGNAFRCFLNLMAEPYFFKGNMISDTTWKTNKGKTGFPKGSQLSSS